MLPICYRLMMTLRLENSKPPSGSCYIEPKWRVNRIAMRELLKALTHKPDSQSPIYRIGNRFGLSYSIRRPSVKAGFLVAGATLSLLFGSDYAGVKVPAIASGLFCVYEVGMSGVLMAGVGSFFNRRSNKGAR